MAPETQDIVRQATEILRGRSQTPEEILALAKRLQEEKQFGYARRILARAPQPRARRDTAATP